MPTQPALTEQQKLLFLATVPDLVGAVDASVAALFDVKSYGRDEVFYGVPRPGKTLFEERPLRIIVYGHVLLHHASGVRRVAGARTVFGESFVLGWDRARRKAPRVDPRVLVESAVAVEPTIVLELPVARYEVAFGALGSPTKLFTNVCNAHRVNELGPDVVRVLAATPELGNVATDELYELLEGATVRDLAPGEVLLEYREVPRDFFVLLEGALTATRPDFDAIAADHPAREAVGVAQVIRHEPMPLRFAARDAARVLRIAGDTFWGLFDSEPGFQRAIIRSVPLDPRPSEERSSGALLVMANPALASDRPRVARVLGGLIDLLAERIAAHLYDWVLVIHLVPSGAAARAPVLTSFPAGFSDTPWDAPWVEHRWLPMPRDPGGLAPLVQREIAVPAAPFSSERPRGTADVVLVDISALDPAVQASGSFDLGGVPHKIMHLTATPEALPPLELLTGRVEVIPIAVLADEDPAGSVGLAAAHMQQGLEDARGLHAKAETLAGGMREVSASLKRSVSSGAHRLAQKLKRNPTSGIDGVQQTWPLGAVRVRFRGPLLDALVRVVPPAASEPVSFESLRLAEADAAAAIATLDRWARGVTGRRVGITLGGGGTYGDVHIPLLRRLAEAKVPIDLVAGASVGSTIGAYYSTLGLAGLDLFWRHRGIILASGVFSFFSSAFFEAALTFDLGSVRLDETETPFFPVVTDGDVGIEWDVRHGTYALGVRASGSLPPLIGPTVIGDRRFLDGGLVANVPADVLRQEGAALVIASNPIAAIEPLPRRAPLPVIGELLLESDPFLRIRDTLRMIPLIFRTAGATQTAKADVVYQPGSGDASLLSAADPDYLEKASVTLGLVQAVADFDVRWRRLLRHPPARAHLNVDGTAIEVDGYILFVFDEPALDPRCTDLLNDLADYLNARGYLTKVAIRVAASTEALAIARAGAVRSYLLGRRVAADRLVAEGEVAKSPADERVTFPIRDRVRSQAEIDRKVKEVEAALAEETERRKAAETLSLARGLILGAAWNGLRGDLQLGRLLALEAAAIDRSTQTDDVLRLALARRGWMRRLYPAGAGRAVRHVAFSPDGRRFATGSADGFVRLWDAAADVNPTPLAAIEHRGTADTGITGVAFSPRGDRLATAGFDGTLRVHEITADGGLHTIASGDIGTWSHWGLAFSPAGDRVLATAGGSRAKLGVWTWQEQASMTITAVLEHAADVVYAAWSPDGARVVSITADGAVLVWSATGGSPAVLASDLPRLTHVAWSGERIAIASGFGARIYEAATHAEALEVNGHEGVVRTVAWSPDGTALVTASEDGTARVWDGARGTFRMSLRGYDGPIAGAAWHPSKALVATWSEGGAAVVWNAVTGEPYASLTGHEGAIGAGAWNADGSRLVTGATDGTARLWEPASVGQATYRGHATGITVAAVHPKDRTLAVSATIDGAVHVWNRATAELVREILPAVTPRRAAWAAASPDGAYIAMIRYGDPAPTLSRTGAITMGPQAAPNPGPANPGPAFEPAIEMGTPGRAPDTATKLAFSPNGALLAVKRSNAVAVWDVASGKRLCEIGGHDVTAIAWAPLGERLAIARWLARRSVAILDPRAPSALVELDGDEDGVWSIAWSPDATRLATASNDHAVHVYDPATAAHLTSIAHGAPVRAVAWSPDGRFLASGDAGRKARVWETATFACVSDGDDHRDDVTLVVWSPDGRFFASAGAGGRPRVWKPGASGRWSQVAILPSHRGAVTSLAFASDSTALVSGGEDGLALVHPVGFDVLVGAVGAIPGRGEMTEAEWAQYMGHKAPLRRTWPRPQTSRAARSS